MGVLGLVAKSSASGGNSLVSLLPLLLMIVVFYFLLIRPQQRRARAQRELVQSLDIGDEVLTIGGIFGTVRSQDDDSVVLEVAPGTSIRMVKSAVARKIGPEDEIEDEIEDEEAGETS